MIYSYGVTQKGAYHEQEGTVCQDAHNIAILEEDLAIGAVADGLGSETHSDIASKLAVEIAVAYCGKRIKENLSDDEIKVVIKNSFIEALDAINEKAQSDGNDSDQYDTTLALVVYKKGKIIYGNSGDSGIIVMNIDGTFEPVTTQQRDENGCVFPLFFGEEKWEFGVKENIASVLLATDGMYETFFPYLLKGEETEIYTSLARYMMSEDSLDFLGLGSEKVQNHMVEFIKSIREDQVSDDKTVLVMLDTSIEVTLQPDKYYNQPDWDTLKKKKEDEFKRMAYPTLYRDKNTTQGEE